MVGWSHGIVFGGRLPDFLARRGLYRFQDMRCRPALSGQITLLLATRSSAGDLNVASGPHVL